LATGSGTPADDAISLRELAKYAEVST